MEPDVSRHPNYPKTSTTVETNRRTQPLDVPPRDIVQYVEPHAGFFGKIIIQIPEEALRCARSASRAYVIQQLNNTSVFWTDGSFKSYSPSYEKFLFPKNQGGVGVVFAQNRDPDHRDDSWKTYYYEGLLYSTINNAELRGISLALDIASQTVQEQDHRRPERIIIFSDSQWALGKIAKFPDTPNTSHEVIDFFREKSLLIHNLGVRLELRWVPAHHDLAGNIEADSLSRHARVLGPSYRKGPVSVPPWVTRSDESG